MKPIANQIGTVKIMFFLAIALIFFHSVYSDSETQDEYLKGHRTIWLGGDSSEHSRITLKIDENGHAEYIDDSLATPNKNTPGTYPQRIRHYDRVRIIKEDNLVCKKNQQDCMASMDHQIMNCHHEEEDDLYTFGEWNEDGTRSFKNTICASPKKSDAVKPFEPSLQPEWQVCEEDSDCAETLKDCSPCDAHGFQIGINKKYLSEWEEKLSQGKCRSGPYLEIYRKPEACYEGHVICKEKKCNFVRGNVMVSSSPWDGEWVHPPLPLVVSGFSDGRSDDKKPMPYRTESEPPPQHELKIVQGESSQNNS